MYYLSCVASLSGYAIARYNASTTCYNRTILKRNPDNVFCTTTRTLYDAHSHTRLDFSGVQRSESRQSVLSDP